MVEEKTFPFNILDELICSYCGSRVEVELEVRSTQEGLRDGILRCDCYEYPVVSGIAVLRQMSQVASTRNVAVDYLRRRDSKAALLWLLGNGSAAGVPGLADMTLKAAGRNRLLRRVRDILKSHRAFHDDPIPLQNGFKATLQSTRPSGYADYLYHRYANPSFLGAIPPLVVLGDYCWEKSNGRVIDLLCGSGHTSAILSSLWPEMEVVSADSDFVNLFLARHFLAPRITAVCIDAEIPLPFTDSLFGGFFCLDGLHYIRSKVALLREMNRILCDDGIWTFAHMHNDSTENESPGTPLSAEGYANRLSFGQHRMISEREVLRQFQIGGHLDLSHQEIPQNLASQNALTTIGAKTDSLWKNHQNLDKVLCRNPDRIAINPLYNVNEVADGLLLKAEWPSESLRRECTGKMRELRESVLVPRHIVDEIATLTTKSSPSDDVRELLRSFVLVSLPDCYPRPGLIPHA